VNRLVGAVLVVLVALVVAQGCSGAACSRDSDCGLGQSCLYPIGSCSARGTCMSFPDPPGSGGCNYNGAPCGDSYPVCGCGVTVMTGCNYPPGYAGGPTNGSDCSSSGSTGEPGLDSGVDVGTSLEDGEAGPPDSSGEETVPPGDGGAG
jgi:hypothetical protein